MKLIKVHLIFVLVSLGGVRLSPLGMSATLGLLYQPRMIDDDYGAVGRMRIGGGNRNTRRKPAPVPLCPPQIPYDLTLDLTWAAAIGSQRLTAWTMARSNSFDFSKAACDIRCTIVSTSLNKTYCQITAQMNPFDKLQLKWILLINYSSNESYWQITAQVDSIINLSESRSHDQVKFM
jgi:hypothetical protein